MQTSALKTSHIQAIQYLQSVYAKDKLMPALRYGRKDVDCLVKNNYEIKAILRMLYCYKVFDDEIETAIILTMTASDSAESFTVTSPAGVTTINVATDLTAQEVASTSHYDLNLSTTNFYTDVQAGNVDSIVLDDKIYIWSYDGNALTIAGLPSYISQEDVTTTSVTDILDVLNCLTNEEVCKLLTRAYKLIN